MVCAIWDHLDNIKNVKNTHGEVLLSVTLQATLLKVTLLHGCISRFLNCANGTKWRNASHMNQKCSEKQLFRKIEEICEKRLRLSFFCKRFSKLSHPPHFPILKFLNIFLRIPASCSFFKMYYVHRGPFI